MGRASNFPGVALAGSFENRARTHRVYGKSMSERERERDGCRRGVYKYIM